MSPSPKRWLQAPVCGIYWPPEELVVWGRLLSGGYGKEGLEQVGAYRVYQDPAELLTHLDEVGIRIVE